MKILADENVSAALVQALRDAGHDLLWALQACPSAGDPEVMSLSIAGGYLLLTHDKQFASKAAAEPEQRKLGIMLIRMEGVESEIADQLVADTLASRASWTNCFAILKANNVRIREE